MLERLSAYMRSGRRYEKSRDTIQKGELEYWRYIKYMTSNWGRQRKRQRETRRRTQLEKYTGLLGPLRQPFYSNETIRSVVDPALGGHIQPRWKKTRQENYLQEMKGGLHAE